MIKKLIDRLKDDRGAVVVEATISLSAFMFFIVTVLTVVNVCYAQAKIGVAVNTTAKEISEYSYLYELTGLRQKEEDFYEQSETTRSEISNTLEGVTSIFNSIDSIGENASDITIDNIDESLSNIQGSAEDIKASVSSIQNTLEEIASDPKAFVLGIAKIAGNEAIQEIKSKVIAAPMAKLLVQKHLQSEDYSSFSESKTQCEEFLKKLRIVPSGESYLNGLDFSDSVIFLNGSTDIMIVVHYKISLIKLLNNDISFSFTQCATTRGWVPVSESSESSSDDDDSGESDSDESSDTDSDSSDEEKSARDYVLEATQNISSSDAYIGTFDNVSLSDAQYFGASYLDLTGYDTEEIKNNLGSDGMSQIYKDYIDCRLEAGARIMCSQDPNNPLNPYFKQQVNYLTGKGYTFRYNETMGVYIAE